MTCRKCKAELDSGTAFCHRCGAPAGDMPSLSVASGKQATSKPAAASPSKRVSSTGAATASPSNPVATFIAGLVVLAVVVAVAGAAIYGVVSLVSSDDHSPTARRSSGGGGGSESAGTDDLPAVIVHDADGGADKSVRFGGWRKDGVTYVLEGTVTWDGSRVIDTMTYDVTDAGVHIAGGGVIVAGGALRANQPSRVKIGCGERPPDSKMTVTITVQH